jgi:hypothetical protein
MKLKESFNETFGDGSLASMARSFGEIIGDTIEGVVDFLSLFIEALKDVYNLAADILSPIGDLFKEFANESEDSTEKSISAWGVFSVSFKMFTSVISIGITTCVEIVRSSIKLIIDIFKAAGETIVNFSLAIGQAFESIKNRDFSGVKAAFSSAASSSSAIWGKVGTNFQENFGKSVDIISSKILKSQNDVSSKVKSIHKRTADNINATYDRKSNNTGGTEKALNIKDGSGSGDKDENLSKAKYALIKAQLEAELMIIKDGLSRQQDLLDTKLKDQLVSYKDYFNEKANIQKEELTKQIALKQQELNENKQLESKASKESDKLGFQAAAVKLQAEMIVLKNRESDIDRKSAESVKEKQKEIQKMVTDMRAQLADATNSVDPTSKFAQIEQKYKDTLDRMIIEGDAAGVEIINGLINVDKAKAQVESLSREFEIFTNKRSVEIEKIKRLEGSAQITSEKAKQMYRDKEKEAIKEEIVLKEKLLSLSEKSGDLVNSAKLESEIAKLKTAQQDVNEFGQSVNQVFSSSLEGFFTDVISGTKTVSQAFKDMAKGIIAQIAQVVAKWIAAKIMGVFNPGGGMSGAGFGGAGGGGGGGMGDLLGGVLGAVFGGFKETGGYTMSGNAYVVGEKGPELFVPSTAGSIIPNGGSSKMGGSNVTMNISTPDANSFRRSASQIGTGYANSLNRNMSRNA